MVLGEISGRAMVELQHPGCLLGRAEPCPPSSPSDVPAGVAWDVLSHNDLFPWALGSSLLGTDSIPGMPGVISISSSG